MAKLPIFSGNLFSWKGTKGTAPISSLGITRFPANGFYIRSHRTGAMQPFLPNTEKMIASEFHDGEGADYFVPSGNLEVYIHNNC